MNLYNNYRHALKNVKKPCAFIDIDALDDNIKQIDRLAKNKNIRIATKSIRSVAVIRRILAKSSTCKGLMCFTGEEAIYLYEQGLDDLLIAYPIWEEDVLRSICELVNKGAKITVMVDSIEHINHLEKIAAEENGKFLICIDIDMSTSFFALHFGVYRSSLRSLKDVKKLVDTLKTKEHIIVDGVMGYEAQIAGVTDNDPQTKLKNNVIRSLKKRSIKEIKKKRKKVVSYLLKQFPSIRFINGGGTGSLQHTTKEKLVTEVTVGSGFYQSHLFDKYRDFSFQPAAIFAIEVTRMPEPGIYTCYGGGYVASGASGKDKLPEIYLPKTAKLIENEGVGEVQTPIRYQGKEALDYGSPIFLRHSKAGELCERFMELQFVQKDKVIDTVTTYRGDGKCFL